MREEKAPSFLLLKPVERPTSSMSRCCKWIARCIAGAAAIGMLTAAPSGTAGNSQAMVVQEAAWLAPQGNLFEPYPKLDLSPGFSEFTDQTLRQVVRLSVGGYALKIKFSNEYGKTPLTLNRVQIAASLGLGAIDPATSRPVTFAGKTDVTIPPGKQIYSDDIAFPAKAFSELAVSIYIKDADDRTGHHFSRNISYIGSGDLTEAANIPNARKSTSSFYMPEIAVLRHTRGRVIVAFGDSITDYTPVMDGYEDWPDQLADMSRATFDVSVVDAGMGGNRWVRSNMGPCGLCRFTRDVLNIEGVTDVVLADGVNDIGLSYRYANGFKNPHEVVSAKQIIDAMKAAIRIAKAKGIKVYVATIVPFESPSADSDYYTSGKPNQIPYGMKKPYNGEQIRQEVNAFIRSDPSIDGVIDIDRAIADPADPLRERKDLTRDSLHPNADGLVIFAQLVYGAIFRSQER